MKMTLNIFIVLALLLSSCDEKKEYPWIDSWDQNEEVPEQNEPEKPEPPVASGDPETCGWTDVTSSYGTLPSYIRIFKSPAELQGKKAVAYIAEADMSEAQWDVWSVRTTGGSSLTEETADSFKTPGEVYDDSECPVVINGGYFYYSGASRYTSSLAVSKSEVLAYNITYASEDWVTVYYPTRAAFLECTDGSFDACWTYVLWNLDHYMYPAPADNSWASSPKAVPSAEYPEGAETFAAKTGIGGGPVLINDGKFTDSYVQELFDGASGISPDSNQPRTAIGATDDGRLIFFVCEGREMTPDVKGLTTADVARVLLQLGCVEAVNLDGGGSSCMLVNGKETIAVSDGSQRAVASAIMLK